MKFFYFLFSLCLCAIDYVNASCQGLPDGYHAVAGQCDAYVKCQGGQVIDTDLCNDGLVFDKWGNPEHIRCKYPYDIDCSDRPSLQPARSTAECPRSNGIWGECSDYVECIEGKAYYKKCPDGLVFNKKHGNCDWPDHVGECSTSDLFGFTCPQLTAADFAQFIDHARFPGHDCRDIYICLKPTLETENKLNSRKLQCDYGKVFNPATLECDEPGNVHGCENYYGIQTSKPSVVARIAKPVYRKQRPNVYFQ